jgi:hypothetical protein
MFTRRIDVYSYRIHTSNHSGIQFFQFTLIHIVLVLAYANGFWVNFTNSANGPATDRNRSTNRDIIIRVPHERFFDAEYTEAPASETIKPEPLYQKQFS